MANKSPVVSALQWLNDTFSGSKGSAGLKELDDKSKGRRPGESAGRKNLLKHNGEKPLMYRKPMRQHRPQNDTAFETARRSYSGSQGGTRARMRALEQDALRK